MQARNPNKNESTGNYITALTNTSGERGSIQHKRLQICAGQLNYANSSGSLISHPLIYTYIAALQARHPHEAVDAYMYGALPGVENTTLILDDGQIESLLTSGYVAARQYYGRPGWYIALGRMTTNNSSDFKTVEAIRVINKVARQVREQQLQYINANIALDGSPEGLLQFKQQCELPLTAMKHAKEITDGEVIIPEGQDIVGTQTIRVQIHVLPLGKLSYIITEIRYTKAVANPL